jgi:hypothetical protein
MLLAVVFFAFVVSGLGHTVLVFTRANRAANPYTAALETAGVGVAAFSFLGVVLNLLHVPLRPLPYLAVASVGPLTSIATRLRRGKTERPDAQWDTEETLCAIALGMVLIVFFMIYYRGANAYPYLEDDDSWMHAEAALYFAKQHTFSVDPSLRALGDFAFYLEPYPPTYDVIMGVLRQIHTSVYETLKLFNVALVTLALANSYLLCREYLESARKGLLAVFILAVLPSFMTHFIWSQSLAMCVFPVAVYAALKALDDPTWVLVAVLAVASLLVTQPVVSMMAGVVLLLLLVFVFVEEAGEAEGLRASSIPRTLRLLTVGVGGVNLSLLFWGAQVAKWGIAGIARLKGAELTTGWQNDYALRHYTLDETLFPHPTKIDQATGWGPVVAGALLLGLIAAALAAIQSGRARHLLAWFAVLFYVVFAPTFGLPSWGSDRTWAYLAVPVALLASSGIFAFASLVGRNTPLGPATIIGAALGILATSAPVKIEEETSVWPPGIHWPALRTPDGPASPVLEGFVQMRKVLEPNTRVYCSAEAHRDP